MLVLRWLVLALLIAAGVCFAFFIATGRPYYRHWGVIILKWTLIATLGFFAVLIAERVF